MADLSAAAAAVETAREVVDAGARHLASNEDADGDQVVAYDLAHAAAAVETARALLDYGAKGDVETRIARAFVADAVHDVATRLLGRDAEWGTSPQALDDALPFVRTYRSPEFLSDLCGQQGPRHLDDDLEMV
ncbi:MAG: acyl-CoA dehydrogenase family protein, partial [Actinomycetota bacterium]